MKFGRITATLVVAFGLGVGASASASASIKSTSTPAQEAAKAKQALKPYLQPAKLILGTRLPKPPPKGKTVVFLECNNPNCTLEGQGVESAAKTLGWTFKEIPYQLSNTSSLISAMDSALQFHPAFVSETGIPVSAFAGEIPKYKAAGVGIVVNSVNAKSTQTLLGSIKGQVYSATVAKMLGNWFIEDSGGKGDALLPTITTVASSSGLTASFKAFVKRNCSKCTVSTVDESLQQFGTDGGVSATVSAVQANPAVNYVIVATSSAATGLRAALDAIGRSNVKIAGPSAEYNNYLAVANGTESAWVNFSFPIDGYADVDAGLHGLAGKKWQYKNDIFPGPLVLVTKESLPKLGGAEAAKATGSFDLPSNYVGQYKALWRINKQ